MKGKERISEWGTKYEGTERFTYIFHLSMELAATCSPTAGSPPQASRDAVDRFSFGHHQWRTNQSWAPAECWPWLLRGSWQLQLDGGALRLHRGRQLGGVCCFPAQSSYPIGGQWGTRGSYLVGLLLGPGDGLRGGRQLGWSSRACTHSPSRLRVIQKCSLRFTEKSA
jgi:hypothetical protein